MKTLPPLCILVVDDFEDAARSMAQLLAMDSHRVRTAHSGTTALQLISEQMPDVILLDIAMPGMSGWELAQCVRRETQGKQPIIVGISGRTTMHDQVRSAEAGFDLHLPKPADPRAVLTMMSRVQEWLHQLPEEDGSKSSFFRKTNAEHAAT